MVLLLWLWRRLAAVAPIRPLAWEHPYAMGAALKKAKRPKKKKKDINDLLRYHLINIYKIETLYYVCFVPEILNSSKF